MSDKPSGSGYFALFWGIAFAVAFFATLRVGISGMNPDAIAGAWFAAVAVALLWWGVARIRTGRADWTVGQDTINLVVGIVAATVALLKFLQGKP